MPLAQPQFRLIKAIFSEQQRFVDNTFYDVSGWTLAHAFNLEFAKVSSNWGLNVAKEPWQQPVKSSYAALPQSYAYAFKWDDYLAPKMLNSLLEQGVKARVALSLTAKTPMGEVAFEPEYPCACRSANR